MVHVQMVLLASMGALLNAFVFGSYNGGRNFVLSLRLPQQPTHIGPVVLRISRGTRDDRFLPHEL